MRRSILYMVFVCLVVAGWTLPAQQVSGSIAGTVQDSQGSVVPNAKVTLINQTQGSTAREVVTSAEGAFVFTPLMPATYTVTVEAPGFKKYSKIDIPVDANAQLGLPAIVLEVGSAKDVITVIAEAVSLETVSSARSGLVNETQVKDLAMNGRNFGALLRTVPGVQSDANALRLSRQERAPYRATKES